MRGIWNVSRTSECARVIVNVCFTCVRACACVRACIQSGLVNTHARIHDSVYRLARAGVYFSSRTVSVQLVDSRRASFSRSRSRRERDRDRSFRLFASGVFTAARHAYTTRTRTCAIRDDGTRDRLAGADRIESNRRPWKNSRIMESPACVP